MEKRNYEKVAGSRLSCLETDPSSGNKRYTRDTPETSQKGSTKNQTDPLGIDRIDRLAASRFAEKKKKFVATVGARGMHQRNREALVRVAATAKSAVLSIVFPPICRLCGDSLDSETDFCRDCDSALCVSQKRMEMACFRCGIPPAAAMKATASLESSSGVALAQAGDCGHCRVKTFEFESACALWDYHGRVRDAVVAAKYASHAALADALGRRLGQRVDQFSVDRPELVTYVPSHWFRQLARGGNGTEVIAMAVARKLRLRCQTLVRLRRPIAKQAWLSDQQRRENLCGAFAVKKSYAWSRSRSLVGKHVLLVDDVLTTGATANEMATVLRRAGARRVSLAVVARAIRTS